MADTRLPQADPFAPYYTSTLRELDRQRQSILKFYASARGSQDDRIPEAADSLRAAIQALGGTVTEVQGYD